MKLRLQKKKNVSVSRCHMTFFNTSQKLKVLLHRPFQWGKKNHLGPNSSTLFDTKFSRNPERFSYINLTFSFKYREASTEVMWIQLLFNWVDKFHVHKTHTVFKQIMSDIKQKQLRCRHLLCIVSQLAILHYTYKFVKRIDLMLLT